MATGATEFIDSTTAAVFFETMYSKSTIVAREQALLLANQVNRQFETDLTMGGTLKIHNISHLTVQTKDTDANAATVYETVTESDTTLTVGTWEYSAIAVETFTAKQADMDLLAKYAPEQGYGLGLSVDDALTALATSLSNTQGTYTVENSFDDVLRAVQYLDDANAPAGDRYLDISPAAKAGFMKLDGFTNADYSSLNAGVNKAAKSAYMGTWMGIPVSFSTNMNGSNSAGHDNMLFQRECIALVIQMKPTTHKFFDIDYFANKVAVEQIRGQGIIRNDHGVDLLGA